MTYHLAENGSTIQIIGQLSINDSVQFLGVTNQTWGRGFPFLRKLKDPVETIGREEATIPIRTEEGAR